MQSRLASLIEVLINVAIGFVVSLFANSIILPLFGHGHPTLLNNLGMTAAFTVLSVARSYAIRRWFNSMLGRAANRMAHAIEASRAR